MVNLGEVSKILDFFLESAILDLCECEGGNSFAFQQTNVCVNPHESGVLRFYSKSFRIREVPPDKSTDLS